MHRTHDGERYPLSAHGLKCPRLVHKIREVLVERLEAENMILFFLCGSKIPCEIAVRTASLSAGFAEYFILK